MEYQLVIQFPANNDDDFEKLLKLENEIEARISAEHEVDGHDFGSGELNLFIYTKKPTEAFSEVQSIINVAEHSELKAAYRYVEGEEYTLLWPNEAGAIFSVL